MYDVPGLQTALNQKANGSTSYTRTHIDNTFFSVAAQNAYAGVVTALFEQEAADTLALNTEIALRAYSDTVFTKTEVNDTFVTSANHVIALNTSNSLHNNRFLANESAISAVETNRCYKTG